MKPGAFVTYLGRRYQVVNSIPGYLRLRPFKGADVQVEEHEVTPWKRPGNRTIRGTLPHRQGRPVVLQYDAQSHLITLRLKHAKHGYTTTLEGLFDLCARQQAMNAKRDRTFKQRTRGRG